MELIGSYNRAFFAQSKELLLTLTIIYEIVIIISLTMVGETELIKKILQVLILIIFIASSFIFSSCTPVEELDHYHEFEYFRAVEKSDFQDYYDICLIGLTEKGKEQEALYFKKYVEHYKVDRIDDPYGVFDFTSGNLKKIIMEGDIKIARGDFFDKFKNFQPCQFGHIFIQKKQRVALFF